MPLRTTKAGVKTQARARKTMARRVIKMKKALSLTRAPRMKDLQKALKREARRSRRRSRASLTTTSTSRRPKP